MLVNTQTANKLISDIWFARADFAKDHPGIIEALVRGIFDGMVELKKPERKQECSKLMAAAYNIPADDALKMFDDAHNTNWAENYQFFLNQNNPTNFERVWRQSYYLYRQIGKIENSPVPFDKVMDFSVIQKLGAEEKYKSQTDEYQMQIAPTTVGKIRAEGDEILTNTVVIHFSPNDWDLHFKKSDGTLYDPNVENVLEGVGKLVGTFGGARVIIEGHTDSSMRGQVPAEVVKTLSMNRAVAVRDALAAKYPSIDASRFYADGLGWDRPADPQDPLDQGKNRRVEIKVYPAEKQ
jgi:outer membrane protein OmpA-like peptidoglycan-associated protein